jgi:hypothetical protein
MMLICILYALSSVFRAEVRRIRGSMDYIGLGWESGQEHQPITAREYGRRNGAKSGP